MRPSKYQMTCPKCKYEFTYDNGYIDKNIARLAAGIREIHLQLADFNLLTKREKLQRKEWADKLKRTLAIKQKEIGELKAIRKVCDQQIRHYEYEVFKELVREKFGETAFRELLDMKDKELEAYKASGLMRHEYSRSGGGSITSINKL